MKPPLTNPPADYERGADYDTPQAFARIGRAFMLFVYASRTRNEHMEWICAGIAHANGAAMFERQGMTLEPSAHPSHSINPRGSWGGHPDEEEDDYDTEEEYEAAKAVEWRCGWCGATENTAKAKAPCP